MISLSDDAKAQLDGYFEGKDKAPIRVFLAGGCCGPKLSLALDEVREGDDSFELSGYTVVAEKALLQAAGAVSIGVNEFGFSVDSENPLEGGGGCSSGGCGSGGGSASGCGGGCSC